MTDYYHVVLETTEKNANGRNEHLYWFDCQDLIELDEDIVEPYVNKSQVYIDGRYIQFDEIRSLTIKKSQQPIDALVNAAQARIPSNVFWVPQRTGVVLGESGLDNVTKKLVKEKQALVKENTNVSGMKENVEHSNSRVFIVHGHDNEAKLDMARFLEKAGLEPIVLHEQASSSQTIIEKIVSTVMSVMLLSYIHRAIWVQKTLLRQNYPRERDKMSCLSMVILLGIWGVQKFQLLLKVT